MGLRKKDRTWGAFTDDYSAVLHPLIPAITHLLLQTYTPLIGFCLISNPNIDKAEVALHCCLGYKNGETPKGLFTRPCGSMLHENHPLAYFWTVNVFSNTMGLILPPVIISLTMSSLMYAAVVKQERRLNRYGVNALRLRTSTTRTRSPSTSSINMMMVKKKREIFLSYMAAGYAGAWLTVFVPFVIAAQWLQKFEISRIPGAVVLRLVLQEEGGGSNNKTVRL